ncbi:MAG: HAD family hydrolase [Elusimicrobia bacterium]|nr:HAD family hydrolase [Elusimicrobiota bacterium]
MTRAVFLDRDGVLNRTRVEGGRPLPPKTLADFEIIPGVPEAVERLKQAGFRAIVATNQPDVATGKQTRSAVEAMHRRLLEAVPLDGIMVCYHVDEDRCGCRKPKPGMLLQAARERGLELPASFMVGDRWRDIEAGLNAGCKTVLIGDGYGEAFPRAADARFPSLPDALPFLLSRALNAGFTP